MKQLIPSITALSALVAVPAVAQTASPTVPMGVTPPVTVTTVNPVAPPATVVTPTGPNSATVTQIPGIAAVSTVKLQSFSDYDLNRDGTYSPMEFAQAMSFLAAANPAAGGATLPSKDKFRHKGMYGKMQPARVTAMLNATADKFAAVDMNNNWRVSPAELTAAAML